MGQGAREAEEATRPVKVQACGISPSVAFRCRNLRGLSIVDEPSRGILFQGLLKGAEVAMDLKEFLTGGAAHLG